MTFEPDEMDRRIVVELQRSARCSWAELGRQVGLSAPAVRERVRRMEDEGVLVGYHAAVDLDRLGFPVRAIARIRYPSGDYTTFHRALTARPEVLECHHVTGEDCYVVTIAARSMGHLEKVTADLARFGSIATSVVYSSPILNRELTELL